MAKKKEFKQIFDNIDMESSDVHSTSDEASKEEGRQETSVIKADQSGDEEALLRAEMLSAQSGEEPEEDTSTGEAGQAVSHDDERTGPVPLTGAIPPAGQESEEEDLDDILGDVRKSLLEEDNQEQAQEPKWWKRIGRSSPKKKVEEDTVAPLEEINLPALSAMQAAEAEQAASQEAEPDEYQEKLDELIDLLDTEEEPIEQDRAVVPFGTPVQPEPEPAPEKTVDLEELKKQAFQSRPLQNENITEVRAIALEGEDEVFVEVEASKPDVLEERISAVENALKPYQRYINFSLAFLGVVMALIAASVIYNAYQRSVAVSAPTEVSNLPFPTSVGLPGGWNFTLGKGALTTNGSWNPSGAEWLQGTEVCRWVALPYSRQLEAVLRTLNKGDPIELAMSNNDKLTYSVYSIKQMSPEEMQKLDSNSPCLLIVLPEKGADKRWVLTALP
ncbi:MAG: hypothetical protein ACM3XO_12515 [Bacteroidota bacterium]|jgi:hypothetical protein